MRSFGPDCARGLDVRTQKSSSPVASASGATGTNKEAGPSEPRQCGDRGARSRALTTLVEAVHNAPADVGSIPTVSTDYRGCAEARIRPLCRGNLNRAIRRDAQLNVALCGLRHGLGEQMRSSMLPIGRKCSPPVVRPAPGSGATDAPHGKE